MTKSRCETRFRRIITAMVVLSTIPLVLHVMAEAAAGQSVAEEAVPSSTPSSRRDTERGNQRTDVVPGRIRVALDQALWSEAFEVPDHREGPQGIERLRPSKELMEVFQRFGLERLWRAMPQLERSLGNGRYDVISYSDFVTRPRRERSKRKNSRPYRPPSLDGMKGAVELAFAASADLTAITAELIKVKGVLSAAPVVIPSLDCIPNDPGWIPAGTTGYDATLAKGRWGFHNSALGTAFLDDFDIDAPEAWDKQKGDPSVVVAVLDNGVDVTHPDLYLNVFLNSNEIPDAIVNQLRNVCPADVGDELTFRALNEESCVLGALKAIDSTYADTNSNGYIDGEDVLKWWSDGIDNDGNGFVDDLVGWNFRDGDNRPFGTGKGDHGTAVAGIIAAIADNTEGISGVAPEVRILPVLSRFGIDEVAYAMDFESVRVINHSQSLSYVDPPADVDKLLSTLEPEGVVFVASLGNENIYSSGSDPSQHPQVVSVSNFTASGRRDQNEGSAYGPKTDVAAPGTGIYSLFPREYIPDGTGEFGGTSAASPMAAGVAALVASQDATLTPEQIRQVLRMTASDPPSSADPVENTPGWDLYSGWGLVNAQAAVDAVAMGTVYPEAKVLSLFPNFVRSYRNEEFSIRMGTVPVRAYMGLPGGAPVSWILRRSAGWDMSAPVVVASGSGAYSDGGTPLASVETDPLDDRQVLELEVTTSAGVVAKDRAVIDLPRAYIATFIPEQRVTENVWLLGFAYGPGFKRYRIEIAPGWTEVPGDFAVLYASNREKTPGIPSYPGELENLPVLMPTMLDIFNLPIALPPDGHATIRLVTEGLRTWSFYERIVIADIVQPPPLAGFPLSGFGMAAGSPVAEDMDGDGDPELILYSRTGEVKALRNDGYDAPGFPITLPGGEYPSQPIAVGDIDGDGHPELVLRTSLKDQEEEMVRVYTHDGVSLGKGWPIAFANPDLVGSSRLDPNAPVLADVTLDGRLGILVAVPKSDPGVKAAEIRAYRSDGSLARSYAVLPGHARVSQPAVGDVDGDGEIDVVAVASGDSINARCYVWKRDGTPLWSVEFADKRDSTSPPVLADVNGDDRIEIVVARHLRVGSQVGSQVVVYDSEKNLLSEKHSPPSGPLAVPAQLRPGRAPDQWAIVYSSWNGWLGGGSFAWAFNPVSGASLNSRWHSGVRYADAFAFHQPVVADLRGTADLEIVLANATGQWTAVPHATLQVNLVDREGFTIEDNGMWPLPFSGTDPGDTRFRGVWAPPLVADIDRDRKLELIVQTDGGKVYAYRLETPAGPGRVAWGEYAHDARRTGNYHGDLMIVDPTTAAPQTVGPANDTAEQMPLLVRVRFTRGGPVEATQSGRWSVRIGTQAATVIQARRFQAEVWLLVRPVVQGSDGRYPLRVEFDDGGIRTWDAYPNAVAYTSLPSNQAQIIAMDRTGSMRLDGKIAAARAAGRFLADASAPNDEIGVVSFDGKAESELRAPLLPIGQNRAEIASAITRVTPSGIGVTSIGAGVQKGVDILADTGSPRSILLLSDGKDDVAPVWHSPKAPAEVRNDVEDLVAKPPGLHIHTVALGSYADEALLYEIAATTGGRFYPVHSGDSAGSLALRLADAYHFARETMEHSRRILTFRGHFAPGVSRDAGDASVPVGSRRLQFALMGDGAYEPVRPSETAPTPPGLDQVFEITRPDGSHVRLGDPGVEFVTNMTDAVVTIPMPAPGRWSVRLDNRGAKAVDALLTASAIVPVDIHTQWVTAQDGIEPQATLRVALVDRKGFVTNASVRAVVTRPDNTAEALVLKREDDPKGPRTTPGIYSCSVTLPLTGSYLATIVAEGKSQAGSFRVMDAVGYYNADATP